MRFQCTTNNLATGLSIATRALSSRSTSTVFECVLLETCEGGLQLTCSDGSISIVTVIPAEIETEGSVILPGRLFLEVVRKMPDGDITASMAANLSVTFRCMGSRTTISGQPSDSFPPLPTVSALNSVKIPQGVLKDMIQQTSFAISTDESRMVLTGCLLEIIHGEASMVALDGFRLGLRKLPLSGDAPDMSAIIPGKTLNEMVKILDGDEIATLTFGGNQMMVEMGATRFYSILIEGEYIKYRQILPTAWKTRIKINRAEFAMCVERASLMAREGKNNIVRMKIEENILIITANSESGDVYEELPVEKEGDDLIIAFNVKYISDVMRALSEDEIYMRFNSSVSPCLICPPEGDAFLYLVLPVRLNA